jgi:CheY-like chemotaxis protein
VTGGDKPLLLLVDDEPMVLRALARLLERAGYAVVTAQHGEAAAEVVVQADPDLVLCDVRMPVLDGPGLLRRLRSRGDTRPLVFLTGYADTPDIQLVELGAQEVLSKPITRQELLAVVRRWSRRAPPEEATPGPGPRPPGAEGLAS